MCECDRLRQLCFFCCDYAVATNGYLWNNQALATSTQATECSSKSWTGTFHICYRGIHFGVAFTKKVVFSTHFPQERYSRLSESVPWSHTLFHSHSRKENNLYRSSEYTLIQSQSHVEPCEQTFKEKKRLLPIWANMSLRSSLSMIPSRFWSINVKHCKHMRMRVNATGTGSEYYTERKWSREHDTKHEQGIAPHHSFHADFFPDKSSHKLCTNARPQYIFKNFLDLALIFFKTWKP